MIPPIDSAIVVVLDVMRPEILTPLIIGLACSLVALLAGSLLLRHRAEQTAPQTPAREADESAPTRESSERRMAQRRVGSPIEVQLALDGKHLSYGTVVDRSVGGLCLNVGCAVEVGTRLTIKPSNASAMIPWTEIEVRSCRQEGQGWQLGCRFLRTPPWSVLMNFG